MAYKLPLSSHDSPLSPSVSISDPPETHLTMTKKEHTTKLVDEKAGLMECLVCGEKYHTTVKQGPDGKFLPENWECVNKCRLIHPDEKPAKKK